MLPNESEIEAFRAGDKLGAYQLFRARTGLSLRETNYAFRDAGLFMIDPAHEHRLVGGNGGIYGNQFRCVVCNSLFEKVER